MQTITVVILAKDEGIRIQDCIKKLVRVCKHIVVYDTGSTDGTIKKIAQMKCENVQLIKGYWDDSFANARNRALQYVKTDWAVFVDADEEFVSSKMQLEQEILTLSKATKYDVFCPKLWLEDGSVVTNNTRIVRVRSSARFQGRVHEYVPTENVISCDIQIRHKGYSAERKPLKERRNLRLLRKQIIEDRKNPRWLYFLVSNYESISPETRFLIIDHLLHGPLSDKKYEHYHSGCMNIALRLSFTLGDMSRLKKYLNWAMYTCPKNIDVVFYKYLTNFINIKTKYHQLLDGLLSDLSGEVKKLEFHDNNFESPDSIIELKNIILFSQERFDDIVEESFSEKDHLTLLDIEKEKMKGVMCE
ncbi:glycosyltransferase [Vibrio vulnificus]|uniref:glycosyltransferase n=1 Tax=Vibrio vulnificus TaxID=672 RepID=UPI000CD299DB|nr:glycosyltransferase [Vibrio vulnificus]EIT7145519.1 glycosyltransferase [Vibrio vulnificus]POB88717.1 hypothetical protein CRN40_06640 [Vibrio vulnificus]